MSKRIKSDISPIQRDFNIVKCAQGELNLGTRSIKDKSKYTRKEKHKNSFLD